MTIDALFAAAQDGSLRATGRLLSLVESTHRDDVLAALPKPEPARVIGITGPPGVGKSTTVAAIVAEYRRRDLQVAVLAVDPSSPYSGGALLGDRIRMSRHINDDGVLIRSVATRGHLGGLAAAIPAAIRVLSALSYDVLSALSYDVIVLETVGVGQSELEIAALADTTVVLLPPSAGDAVQAAKAGLLEVADLIAINKADLDGADRTARDLRTETDVPVLKLVAARGDGVDGLLDAIESHVRGDLLARRTAHARAHILSLAQHRLQTHPGLAALAALVADGRYDAYAAAQLLFTSPPDPPG
jgi:LAO/AO transport system kinase